MSLKSLSDQDLIASTKRALQAERTAEVVVLRHFREIEARKLWTHANSIYQYLIDTFALTADEVYPRLQAMRLATVVPEIESKLESGDLSMTNVLKAQQIFKSESKKRKVSVEEKRCVLRSLEKVSTRNAEKVLAEKYPASYKLAEKTKPVAPNQNLIQFYVDDEMLKDIERLKARFSHQMPEGRMVDLMRILIKITDRQPEPRKRVTIKTVGPGAGVKSQIDKEDGDGGIRVEETQNRGATESSREDPSSTIKSTGIREKSRSRHISADVKREMEKTRSEGCAHTGPAGERCGSIHFLQMDHVHEFRHGGSNELHNLRWLCGFHNRNRCATRCDA